MNEPLGSWDLSLAQQGRDVRRFPGAELLSALQQTVFCGVMSCAPWKLPSGCFCGHWCNQLRREQGFSSQKAIGLLSPLLPLCHWSPGVDTGSWEPGSPLRCFSLFCEPTLFLLPMQPSLCLAMGASCGVSLHLSDEKNYFFLSLRDGLIRLSCLRACLNKPATLD